jgi:hypothetical protein
MVAGAGELVGADNDGGGNDSVGAGAGAGAGAAAEPGIFNTCPTLMLVVLNLFAD